MNTYISCFDWIRSTSGLEFQSLFGNMARFTTNQALGTNTLAVPASGFGSVTTALNPYDRITIFDGSSSEICIVQSLVSVGGASITLTAPTQYAHVAGTAWCSDGILGSLSDSIVSACQYVESICRQSLLQTTYTSEILTLPSMRAALSNDNILHFRPRHFPIAALSSLTINTTQLANISYDTSQVFIDSDKQVCSVPQLTALGSQSQNSLIWNVVPFSRQQTAWLTINYAAGYSINNLPSDITEAAILLTADILAKRQNPVGAPEIGSGSRHISAVLRGDLTGESLLHKRAKAILDNYALDQF